MAFQAQSVQISQNNTTTHPLNKVTGKYQIELSDYVLSTAKRVQQTCESLLVVYIGYIFGKLASNFIFSVIYHIPFSISLGIVIPSAMIIPLVILGIMYAAYLVQEIDNDAHKRAAARVKKELAESTQPVLIPTSSAAVQQIAQAQ